MLQALPLDAQQLVRDALDDETPFRHVAPVCRTTQAWRARVRQARAGRALMCACRRASTSAPTLPHAGISAADIGAVERCVRLLALLVGDDDDGTIRARMRDESYSTLYRGIWMATLHLCEAPVAQLMRATVCALPYSRSTRTPAQAEWRLKTVIDLAMPLRSVSWRRGATERRTRAVAGGVRHGGAAWRAAMLPNAQWGTVAIAALRDAGERALRVRGRAWRHWARARRWARVAALVRAWARDAGVRAR